MSEKPITHQEQTGAETLEAAAFTQALPGYSLARGRRLGRYVILEPLGAGGMGAVYRAQDETLERTVALKVLAPGMLNDDDARRRFRKEALALAKLSHPHIATVFDAGSDDGIDYIVMELVAGESLSEKLRAGPLPVRQATLLMTEIAEALDEAHDRGIVHRDLKPANVMISPKGRAKVLDFGLAKLLATAPDATLSIDAGMLIGTPRYMSPEQAEGKPVDARTDLWSLGVVYFQMLTGRSPFEAESHAGVLRAIVSDAPVAVKQLRPDVPAAAEHILGKSLEKKPGSRYQTAAEMVRDGSDLLAGLSATSRVEVAQKRSRSTLLAAFGAVVLLAALGSWLFVRWSHRQWARDEAVPEITRLLEAREPLAAMDVLQKALRYLPDDPHLAQTAEDGFGRVSIDADPAGTIVEVQDYAAAGESWRRLGETPLRNVLLPVAFLRWRISKPGVGQVLEGRAAASRMSFDLAALQAAPSGMVPVPAGAWSGNNGVNGFLGPYELPAYSIDQYEVTNAEYQKFVDSGGYEKKTYWTQRAVKEGHELTWEDEMKEFRDATNRPGPAGWMGGHYAEGKASFPVTGISWFEASAYAAFAGKSLPVFAEWYRAAPSGGGGHVIPLSNLQGSGLAPVGEHQAQGPFGTYDMAGNAREWVVNADDAGKRYTLGGSWRSPTYLAVLPDAVSPLDRSEENGFRCVKNSGPMSADALKPVQRASRDFSKVKPVSDEVFHAYKLLYTSSKAPLNEQSDGLVAETADWREERVTFDTGYAGERMSAYLFLPKNVSPPYQTLLFFPSARIYYTNDNHGGRNLTDLQFFSYVVQSGRAVMYPIYQDTYERRTKYSFPSGDQDIQLTTQRYKDASRSLDYLATRKDIDSSKLGYLGVSMGAADGVIYATLMQERLRTTVLLDGGYFIASPPPGGDQADFAPRMKKPVLMVNGRYDYTFSLDLTQDPLFNMLGTPAADKKHLVLETSHDVTEQKSQLVKAVLGWLDQYLGPVHP